jgi:nucleoside-diphosphate-sugar epimerase
LSDPEVEAGSVTVTETAQVRVPDFRGRVVLVTGAAGFIGSHLVDALLEQGARVRGLDNFATGKHENLPSGNGRFELVEADLRDPEACRKACRGVAYVFHQAALGSVPRSVADPGSTISVNVAGTANVLQASRDARVRRVVYASSSSVYGDSDRLPKKEGEEGAPVSPYALSKRMVEQLADIFTQAFGLESIGLRYFNVYGPRQDPEGPYAAVIPRFFHAYFAREAPVIYGDGLQSRDFTYVDDAVRANLLAAAAPADACGRAYNVGGGGRTTVRELAHSIREAAGGGPEPLTAPPRAGDVLHSLADLTRVREAIGYEPQWDLSRGLARSREYYARAASVGSGRAVERRSAR